MLKIIVRVILTVVLLLVAGYFFFWSLLYNVPFFGVTPDTRDRFVSAFIAFGGLLCLGAIFLLLKRKT